MKRVLCSLGILLCLVVLSVPVFADPHAVPDTSQKACSIQIPNPPIADLLYQIKP